MTRTRYEYLRTMSYQINLTKDLNMYGEQGWELIYIEGGIVGNMYELIMKRPLEDVPIKKF